MSDDTNKKLSRALSDPAPYIESLRRIGMPGMTWWERWRIRFWLRLGRKWRAQRIILETIRKEHADDGK